MDSRFISGVIEGFYGIPWRQDQRFDLYRRLKDFGLNTYMYAPKDDAKHRKCWRDLYVGIEQENLKRLINGAEEDGISFVYALSPGLDIIFSCPKDIEFLKNKLKQVSDLGCKCFALLFDDIEPELSLPDKQDFDSFADAQVTITNMIYSHLGKPPIFLFCPTEYCTTRAKPSVQKSEYLRVLGNKLNENIDILWTGPKVVSREIPVSSIEQVAKVLKRKPVIWDNSHSNDYDQRRVFLGPYIGRPTELYNHVNGVLSNPNCEYEANYIALYTIKTWISCCKGKKKNSSFNNEKSRKDTGSLREGDTAESDMDTVSSESTLDSHEVVGIRFEKEDGFVACEPDGGSPEGMDVAVNEGKSADKMASLECRPVTDRRDEDVSAEDVAVEYDVTRVLNEAVAAWAKEFRKERQLKNGFTDLSTSPSKLAVTDDINSLREPIEKGTNEIELKNAETSAGINEQKDVETDKEEDCCPYHVAGKRMKLNSKLGGKSNVTESDLMLLIHLFYLPYEHGDLAKNLVSEFKWLQSNAPPVEATRKTTREVEQWEERAKKYHERCQAIADMFLRITNAPNKPLVQELYPYIWDIKEVAMLLNAFVKWLGSKSRNCKSGSNSIPEDPEPWMIKGGIAEELERLLPADMASDVSPARPAFALPPEVYTIRPYLDTDKDAVYDICKQLYLLEINEEDKENDLFEKHPNLAGDRFIGPYLQHAQGSFFVLEDGDGLCGYCVAVFDAKKFSEKSFKWFKEISRNYRQPTSSSSNLSIEESLIESLYNPSQPVLQDITATYPAQLILSLLPRVQETNIGRKILSCLISILKGNDITGVHTQVSRSNCRILSMLNIAGFNEIKVKEKLPEAQSLLVRDLRTKQNQN